MWRDGLRDAWTLAAPGWRGRDGAWGQAAVLVALTLGLVAINVRFSVWNNAFYDALQARDLSAFGRQLAVFGALAAAYIATAVARMVMQQRLEIRWREKMTEQFLARWLRSGTPYRTAGSAAPDNPDQRIAEDIRSFVSSTIDLTLGLLNACVTLLSFVAILWRLSGRFIVPWPKPGWPLPGAMVWAALGYSVLGSALVRRLGAPLIGTNARQQQVEADFRYALVQVRDHAEAIALAGGEPAERRRLGSRFDAIRDNWSAIIRYTKRLTLFNAGYGQLASVFPLLAASPRYFAGQIQLGALMQTAQAFGQVQGSLSWFVDAYDGLADWRATVMRLAAFRVSLEQDPAPAPAAPSPAADALRARGLEVAPPGAPRLLELPELELAPGQWLLVGGPSGSGKSSLLRVLAGLWPAARGSVEVPAGAMFVPQRPYLPRATLAEVLAWPQPAAAFGSDAYRSALEAAELGGLTGRIDETDAWSSRLSPGEQQRVQFARVLLHRPDWIVLDEATSALDAHTQQLLLERLRAALPRAGVLSVGHRSELAGLHDRVLAVQGRRLLPLPVDPSNDPAADSAAAGAPVRP